MEFLKKSDKEIKDIAQPIWDNLVKTSNIIPAVVSFIPLFLSSTLYFESSDFNSFQSFFSSQIGLSLFLPKETNETFVQEVKTGLYEINHIRTYRFKIKQ